MRWRLLEYLCRPEMAGSFTALPTNASSMYIPDLEARSNEERLSGSTRSFRMSTAVIGTFER